jgi:hypothetical protein
MAVPYATSDRKASEQAFLYNKVLQWSGLSTKRYTNHEIKSSFIAACLLPAAIDVGGANL